MKERRIIQVDERLPLLQTIPLSLQHLFAMFGSTVLVPFLLKVDPATALFMNGIGTICISLFVRAVCRLTWDRALLLFPLFWPSAPFPVWITAMPRGALSSSDCPLWCLP